MLKKICAALAVVFLLISLAAAETQTVTRDYILLDKDADESQLFRVRDVTARQFILLDKETEDVYLFRGERMLSRAATGMRLIDGDFVITGTSALAFFQADASKFFQLGPNGSVSIIKSKGASLVMSLKTGEFFFDIRSPLESGETLIIEAGNTTMSIRGTSGKFSYLKHKDTETASVEIYTGKISMSAGDSEYTVESGKALTLTCVDDTVTATEGTASDTLPEDFSGRVLLAVEYDDLGQPMPTTAPIPTQIPAQTPAQDGSKGGIEGIQPEGQGTCPGCSAKVSSRNEHKCAVCDGWTCNGGKHGQGVCNAYTCLNCGATVPSPGAHICKICERWMCNESQNHGNGVCNAAPTLRCPVCLDPVSALHQHQCGYCGGFTCQARAHGIGVCVFYCPICGELVPSMDAHKCDYPGCDGYICDMNH